MCMGVCVCIYIFPINAELIFKVTCFLTDPSLLFYISSPLPPSACQIFTFLLLNRKKTVCKKDSQDALWPLYRCMYDAKKRGR